MLDPYIKSLYSSVVLRRVLLVITAVQIYDVGGSHLRGEILGSSVID